MITNNFGYTLPNTTFQNNKSIEHYNFIGIYDEFFSSNLCKDLIEYFEWSDKVNLSYKRTEPAHIKNDLQTNLDPVNIKTLTLNRKQVESFITDFNKTFWDECYSDYISKYSTLQIYDTHGIKFYKLQKTMPGQGYHVWHAEDGGLEYSSRILVYTLYLNDVDEGGETEFLYLPKRISPKEGRLALFPANYPWTHRGNQPLSGPKYIMTGWIEFV